METVESFLNLAQQGKIPDTNETYYVSRNIKDISNNSWTRLVSDCTIEYLGGADRRGDLLVKNGAEICILKNAFQTMKACPLKTKMDGNCLLHAVAKAIWGVEGVFHEVMRKLVTQELTEHKAFYQQAVDKRSEDDYDDNEYGVFLEESRKSGEKLQVIHIFALANIIKRPIILYAAEIDMYQLGIHEQGVAGLILPTRHGSQSVTGRPIAISWSDDLRNHYVPLCLVEGEKFEWPLLETVYAKSLKEGETFQDYIIYDDSRENKKGLASLMTEMESKRTYTQQNTIFRFTSSMDDVNQREKSLERALEMLFKLQEEQLGVANKQYNTQRNVRMRQGKKQIRFLSIGDQLLRIVDSDDEAEEDEDDEEKLYDIVVPVGLKSTKGNVMIGFNTNDDPEEVSAMWVSKLKIPNKNLGQTIDFVQKYQKYARANPEKFQEKKPVPRFVSSLVRNPTISSKYIPFLGPYYWNGVLNPANFKAIFETLEKNMADIKITNSAVNELIELNNTVSDNKKDYANANFSDSSLCLISLLLKPGRWPDNCLFQIIDFTRIIILFHNAAIYFLHDFNSSQSHSIFSLLLSHASNEKLDYPKMKTLLGFIENLFYQQCLHNFLIKSQLRIIHVISGIINKICNSPTFDEKKKVIIFEITMKIMCNYAFLWKNTRHHEHISQNNSANIGITLVLEMLKYKPSIPENLLQQGLIVIGTILQKNGGSKINKNDLAPWISSPNPILSECVNYIFHLLSSEVVDQQFVETK